MHGCSIVTEEAAAELRRLCLRAIEALSASLLVTREALSSSDYEHRRRATGSIIGMIQVNLLDPLFVDYPELDDLSDRGARK